MLIKYIGCNAVHREKYYEKNIPEGSPTCMFLNIKSKAVFTINGKSQIVEPNSVILYNRFTPQHYKYYEYPDGKVELYSNDWIHFDPTDEEMSEIKEMQFPFDTIIKLDDATEVNHIMEKMHSIFFSNSESKDKKLYHYLMLMLNEIKDSLVVHDSAIERYHTNLYTLRGKIYSQDYFKPSVEWMARYLDMSKSYFQYVYKKTFGISPMEDCILSRVERAKYKLKNFSYNITKISEELGYKDADQFIKQFKKHTGTTPLQYRKKHLNKTQK